MGCLQRAQGDVPFGREDEFPGACIRQRTVGHGDRTAAAAGRVVGHDGDRAAAAAARVRPVLVSALKSKGLKFGDPVDEKKWRAESPLVLKEYRYGGLGFRGSGEWEGAEGVEFLTSEGKTRKDGHATAAAAGADKYPDTSS